MGSFSNVVVVILNHLVLLVVMEAVDVATKDCLWLIKGVLFSVCEGGGVKCSTCIKTLQLHHTKLLTGNPVIKPSIQISDILAWCGLRLECLPKKKTLYPELPITPPSILGTAVQRSLLPTRLGCLYNLIHTHQTYHIHHTAIFIIHSWRGLAIFYIVLIKISIRISHVLTLILRA